MVLAMALKANVPQHDHFIVALDLLERLFQDLAGVLPIAGEKLLE
jgi:hypothetical protein